MLQTAESIVPGWQREESRWTYPAPKDAQGFIPWGFDRVSDSALDMLDWAGFDCEMAVHGSMPVTVTAQFADGRQAQAVLHMPTGRQAFFLSLEDFCLPLSRKNIWRFLQAICVDGAEALSVKAIRSRGLIAECAVRGRSAHRGERVYYEVNVVNPTKAAVVVSARQTCIGWESVVADVEPALFELAPGEERGVRVGITVPDLMPPGSHERTEITFLSNGSSDFRASVSLDTLSALEHPYIYHDQSGWQEAARRGQTLPQFRQSYDAYVRDADLWLVTPPETGKPYCYATQVEHQVMSAAYAYAMTGHRRYAEKLAEFFRYFAPAYMARQRGCSQSYVQEGHFFQHLAISYDIIHASGVLSAEDHAAIERCFRFYMTVLDQHVRSGHISNWLLSELTGALYCALALQDYERVDRFVFGPGGIERQLICGAFNDGWWYECSVSYNTWVSSMLLHTARALRPLGIDWIHHAFPAALNRHVDATWLGQAPQLRFDMDNERRGGNRRICMYIKDLFDAPLNYLDRRGVIFGICDSYERRLEGVHFGSTYELAYQYYHDPRYAEVIRQMPFQDCVFGVESLPEGTGISAGNSHSDNIGIAMLRSAAPGRDDLRQIQAVLRFGSHGYAHGHFDIASLLSVTRYGRSFFNPEHVWWGYLHFMYKFYVQNSMSKNMVVVDEKHQNVADSRCILFASGRRMQAACVETTVTWSYPPYGGMIYNDGDHLADRCRLNACTLPDVPNAPDYGAVTGHTEPIFTRRLLCVCDDYLVLFDCLRGTREHRFSSLFQIKGFEELKGSLREAGHTRRMSDDPLGDAQFITDCRHVDVTGPSCARFVTAFGEGEDLRGTRSCENRPGLLKMDIHSAWPLNTHQVVGLAAEDHHMYIPVRYRVEADTAPLCQGDFGAWLGYGEVLRGDLSGAESLTVTLLCPPLYTEQNDPYDSPQGLFIGNGRVILSDGGSVPLCSLPCRRVNVDEGHGIGRDYEGGRVLIGGQEMPDAIPVSPLNHAEEAVLTFDLTGLDALRFEAELGVDAFPGDERQRRRTYAIQTQGVSARFVTVVEPYENDAAVACVRACDADTVEITLKTGQVQRIAVLGLEEGTPQAVFRQADDTETLAGVE